MDAMAAVLLRVCRRKAVLVLLLPHSRYRAPHGFIHTFKPCSNTITMRHTNGAGHWEGVIDMQVTSQITFRRQQHAQQNRCVFWPIVGKIDINIHSKMS